LEIKHFDVQTPDVKPPDGREWKQQWHGYYRLAMCWDDGLVNLSEHGFEVDCFLSILSDIQKKHVTMLELGAGWGEWCMALAGVIGYKLIPIVPESYRCFAVEAEPTHHQWLMEHFKVQHIKGEAIFGAVSDKIGTCRFNTLVEPSKNYGQSMSFTGGHIKQTVYGLLNLVCGKAIEVPTYTLDSMTRLFGHIDIVHMDVQGAELRVIEGVSGTINEGLVDYFIIGTHRKEYNSGLRRVLEPMYECIIDLLPHSTNVVNSQTVECLDGMQVFKRRNNEHNCKHA